MVSQLLYNVCLTLLALPALPFAGAALAIRPRYRLGLGQRLGFFPTAIPARFQQQRPFWVHAPSVGEILATRPFLRALKETFPGIPILLSALTPTAYTAARENLTDADLVIYFPLDYPLFVRRVLRRIDPVAFFFTETEMWPNFLLALARRRIPTFLVSGRFSTRALARYRFLRPLFHPVFQSLTRCCMQTVEDAERLIAAGARKERVSATGNFKMDGVSEGSGQGQTLLKEAGLVDRPLLIGASTHPGEEELLLRVFRRLRGEVPTLLLLLAPRHPQRFLDVEQLLIREGWRYQKRSQSPTRTKTEVEVFLLDTLGELSSFYHSAALTFVGGSLVKGPGGHSVVEPALSRTPVCFGPYTRNFSMVVEQLINANGGFEVRQEEDFYRQALPFFTNPHHAQEIGQRAYEVVKRGQGAVHRTMTVVQETLRLRDDISSTSH